MSYFPWFRFVCVFRVLSVAIVCRVLFVLKWILFLIRIRIWDRIMYLHNIFISVIHITVELLFCLDKGKGGKNKDKE